MLDHDDALTRHEWLIAPQLLQTDAQTEARILLALPVDMAALQHDAPGLVRSETDVEWDEEKGTLRAWQRDKIGVLALKSAPLAKPEAEVLHPAMLRWIGEKDCRC